MSDKQTPERLYHYTSAHGLVGIVEGKSLWASDIYYLNDSLELRHGLELARSHIMAKEAATEHAGVADRWRSLLRGMEHLGPRSSQPVFASSLSEIADSLSQWRAYCPQGGFCIGFPFSALDSLAWEQGFRLEQCDYGAENQASRIHGVVDYIGGSWVNQTSDAGRSQDDLKRHATIGRLICELYRHAPLFKSAAFAEEHEWRLVSTPEHQFTEKSIQFRTRQGLIVPYVAICLPSDPAFWRSVKVVVGPTPHPEESLASTEKLLRWRIGFAPHVSNTVVPYRYW